jgi:hypothetical protein
MIFRKHFWLASLVMLFLSLVPSAMRAGAGGHFKQENRPENLKALLESIHDHIYVKKDTRSAGYLFASMVPNEERARKALRNDLPPATFKKIFDYHKDIGMWWDDNIHSRTFSLVDLGFDYAGILFGGRLALLTTRRQRTTIVVGRSQ